MAYHPKFMINRSFIFFVPFLLSSVLWANLCKDLYGSSYNSNYIDQSERKQILDSFVAVFRFLNEIRPQYEHVRSSNDFLNSLDLNRSKYAELIAPLAARLQISAEKLLSDLPNEFTTIAQIQAQADKLRLLNNPVLRNLLTESQQFRVGRQAWIRNFALWEEHLSATEKAVKIREEISLLKKDSIFKPEEQLKLPKDIIEIFEGTIQDAPVDSILASVECHGFCESEIHSMIKHRLPLHFASRALQGAEAFSIAARQHGSATNKNIVLVADDSKVPLRQMVTNALLEAERAGFTSVALPALRTGNNFGAVESSNAEVSYGLLSGISDYIDKGKGIVKKIVIAVPRNSVIAKEYVKEIARAKESFERSLRHNLRAAYLSGEGFEIVPNLNGYRKKIQDSPIYRTMMLPWDLKRMNEIYKPLELGKLQDQSAFVQKSPSVLNMPIKMPGSAVRVPIELAQFREFLQLVFDHEVKTNPLWNEFFVYLTVDQSPVAAGNTHRQPGIHIDGVQGVRYPVKLPPEHTYSASNTLGTIFYPQKYNLEHVDPARDHVHNAIWDQTDFTNRLITKDFVVYFWSSYSPHEPQVTKIALDSRTFVRVEFSMKIYGSHGDTQNPLFNYDWQVEHRPVPSVLFEK